MTDPAIIRAKTALNDLQEALADVQITHPAYMPGHGPNAADACRQLLDVIGSSIHNLSIFLGMPDDPSL